MKWQRSKVYVLIGLIAIITGFLLWENFQAPKGQVAMKTDAASESFEVFEGNPPLLNITFHYPKDWKKSVSRARDAEEETVQLMGPRDLKKQFSTSFAVIGKKQGENQDIENEINQIINRNKNLAEFKIVARGGVKIGGADAQKIISEFVMELPLGMVNPSPAVMREEVAVVMHSGLTYHIYFVGTKEQHLGNNHLFRNLLKSFQFKE